SAEATALLPGRLAAVDPGQGRLERRIAPRQQVGPPDRDDLVGQDPAPFEAGAVSRDEIARRMDEHVAIRQAVELRWQRRSHRPLAENAHAAERLHPAREALRGAGAQAVDENRDRPAERLHAL